MINSFYIKNKTVRKQNKTAKSSTTNNTNILQVKKLFIFLKYFNVKIELTNNTKS